MYEFVIISKSGEQIYSHKELTYKALVEWGQSCNEDTPIDSDHWQIRDPDGQIIKMMTMSGRSKLII